MVGSGGGLLPGTQHFLLTLCWPLQITFVDFLATILGNVFGPKCLDVLKNLKDFVSCFVLFFSLQVLLPFSQLACFYILP